MAAPGLHWRNAQLPSHTALYAIGDIHAHSLLLATMLGAIEANIKALPPATHAHIVFLGDYIDRGPDAPATLDLLIDFEARIQGNPDVTATFLCGNHDEIFARFLRATGVVDVPVGTPDKRDFTHLTSRPDGSVYLRGFEAWFFRGNGYTTVKNYVPTLDETLIDHANQCFDRQHPEFSAARIYQLIQTLTAHVPKAHDDFLQRMATQSHIVIGDYLLTHAGLDPQKSLAELGIGEDANILTQHEYLDFLMLRDPFLWRDDLPKCPYIVIHGHTPSIILNAEGNITADGQKDYRLNIDSCVYAKNGALTCYVHDGRERFFMAVNKVKPERVSNYATPPFIPSP